MTSFTHKIRMGRQGKIAIALAAAFLAVAVLACGGG
jgi:hypothetical protein